MVPLRKASSTLDVSIPPCFAEYIAEVNLNCNVKTISANFSYIQMIGKKDRLTLDGVDLVGGENFVTPIKN